MHYTYKYQDRIYIEHDNGEQELFWQNNERDSEWGNDNAEDSEYNKMMELHSKWDFIDYDNPELPDFWHYVIEIKYKVTKKQTVKVSEKICRRYSLVEEFYNT